METRHQKYNNNAAMPELADYSFSSPNRQLRSSQCLSFKSHRIPEDQRESEENAGDFNNERARARQKFREERNKGFRCVNRECKAWIPLHEGMGTKNRNHCPCCLSSKHVDDKTGDRRASCGGPMNAIALTSKMPKENRYASPSGTAQRGEIMLVHECTGCGFHRINRIAADDNGFAVLSVLNRSFSLTEEVRIELQKKGINLLGKEDIEFVRVQFEGI